MLHSSEKVKQCGRYEFVALPLLYRIPITATIDDYFGINVLQVDALQLHASGTVPRIEFSVGDLWSNARLCVNECHDRVLPVCNVVDHVWPDGVGERLYSVETKLVVGECLLNVEIHLTRRSVRSTALVLGSSDVFSDNAVYGHEAFIAGMPKHNLVTACSSFSVV